MRVMMLAALVSLLGACSDWDVVERHYATRAEVPTRDNWLPDWIPANATSIHDVHNIDTSDQTIAFSIPPRDIQRLVAELRPILKQHESAALKVARVAEWAQFQPPFRLEGYYVCKRYSRGVLLVNRSTGRALYERDVMWALPPCSEDI